MPLVFSPLSENVLESAPRKLLPNSAFIMRQLGAPPPIDKLLHRLVATTMDCAIAFERLNKAFLLSGDRELLKAARAISDTLRVANQGNIASDFDQLRNDVDSFFEQANRATEKPTEPPVRRRSPHAGSRSAPRVRPA